MPFVPTYVTIEINDTRLALPPGTYVASCREDAPVEVRLSRLDTGEIVLVVSASDPPAWCRAFNQPTPDQPTWWRGRVVAPSASATPAASPVP